MRQVWDAAAGLIMGVLGAVPMWGAKIIAIGVFVALAIWALSLPRAYAYRGAEDGSRWRDVRIWAVVVIVLEIIPYLFF